jgi:hypothetical protein
VEIWRETKHLATNKEALLTDLEEKIDVSPLSTHYLFILKELAHFIIMIMTQSGPSLGRDDN